MQYIIYNLDNLYYVDNNSSMAPPVMTMTKDQSKVEVDNDVHQICGTGLIPSIKMKLFLVKQ